MPRAKKQPKSNPQPPEKIGEMFSAAEAEEIAWAARRAEMMSTVAKYRWQIARHYHTLENGEHLDFDRYPFQRAIYEDDAQYLVVMGSVQWGKSEFLICSSIAMALAGMGVFYVIDKYEKRDKIVKSRIDPTLKSVPFYKELMKAAKARGAESDSTRFKHLGDGFINFVGSNSDGDFSSYKADCAIVDEHQLCLPHNIGRLPMRMSGSTWRFRIIVGNPRNKGTRENQNLDWEFQNSDQRKWHIPCDHCGLEQVIAWDTHVVREVRNKAGGVLAVEIRDEDWTPQSYPRDIRPICLGCKSPMNRLHKQGFWKPLNPGHLHHGYQLSNLYNPKHARRRAVRAVHEGPAQPELDAGLHQRSDG
jgi:phage terminase large subunit GpA-like protein